MPSIKVEATGIEGPIFSRVYNQDTEFGANEMRGAYPLTVIRSQLKDGGLQFIVGADAVWMTAIGSDTQVKVDDKILTHGACKMLAGQKKVVSINNLSFNVTIIP